ncbi:hypothetical protein KQI65_06295 [bacterium]|nr:hypothetical protein [bacterium]
MKHTGITILLLLLLGTLPAAAQFGPPDDDEGPRGRLEELRRLKMIEALDLNEEQAVRLTVREKKFREQEEKERGKRDEVLEELRSLVKDKASDAEIMKTVEKLEELGMGFVKRRQDYLRSLTDFLSAEQIARLVLFEHHFAKEIKRILGKARRPHPPKR